MARYHDFGAVADIKRARTKIRMPFRVITSMSVGDLIPCPPIEVLAGDTWKMKTVTVARTSSPFLRPIMDNLFMDIHYFFVPYRLCYEKAEGVFGKATPSQYDTDGLESIPTLPECTISELSVGDYLGLPPGTYPEGLSVLKFRAFALIWDKWFRNENIVDETFVQKGERVSSELPNNNAWSPNNYFGKVPKVSKIKDIFTACLPAPQKGLASTIPVRGGRYPVVTANTALPDSGAPYLPIHYRSTMAGTSGMFPTGDYLLYGSNYSVNPSRIVNGYAYSTTNPGSSFTNILPDNLVADLSQSITGDKGLEITVNDMRFAFAFQKMLELDARAGSRYNEYLLGHFGVVNPDARLQMPEYLGGGRVPITMQQVAQTTPGTEESSLGEVAAFSLSNGYSRFTKAFTEPGYIIPVMCVKQPHTYQQGIDKSWFRVKREDFYDPLFAHLGEQPIYREQIFAPGISSFKSTVFGYNEYGAEYRYIPNSVTGQMRSSATNSLDIWHLADKFDNAPVLNKQFIEENSNNINRVLAVPSENGDGTKGLDNFMIDIGFDSEAVRVMPLYSTPGLIDH